MKKFVLITMSLMLLVAITAQASDVETLAKKIKRLEKRMQKVEVKSGTDRIDFTGEFRFETHGINAEMPAHMDGMQFQQNFVNTLFYMNTPGANPSSMSLDDINNAVNDPANYGMYQMFLNGLTYDQLQGAYAQFAQDPAMFNQIMGMLQMDPRLAKPAQDWDNSILYTSRLRLNMKAKVADNVTFNGRLAMYKPWGDSSGVQVFNGQPNSIGIDGTGSSVPNSDVLRVDRAHFDWKNIAGTKFYLSFGRRPSTNGPPMHFRQDEMRGGTPLGTIIDFQFDGITAGWSPYENSTLRACYGLGYESGFGSAEQLRTPGDRLKDSHFFGFNWDIYNKGSNFLQATVARAFDVTDGFNGTVVMQTNPLTGMAIPGNMIMRYSPTANLGDIDMASLLYVREQGQFDLFASYSLMRSNPTDDTTPFGGLFTDPFGTPEEQDGSMFYAGARYNFKNDKTKLGFEYNQGSEYWFNFAHGSDDIVAPKTNTRGKVMEFYVTHRINKRFIVKLDYIDYAYDYSGSGWHMGAPKDLDNTPMLGFPTYDSVKKMMLSMTVRF
jgi:Protein of unknown function (DUF3373)